MQDNNKQSEYDKKDKERLDKIINRVDKLVSTFAKIVVIECSHVGSFQLQKIRKILCGEAEIVRGKVIHLRTALQKQLVTLPELKPFLRYIKGEIGLIFTNSDIFDIITKVEAEKAATTVKLHSRAPHDIIIPGGQTDLDPGGNYYFATLNIPSKVLKGKIFLMDDYFKIFNKGDLITKYGHKLISALNIKPIIRQAKVICAYDSGIILDKQVLEQASPQIENSLKIGIQSVAAVSVAIGVANKSTVFHAFNQGLWNVRALSVQLELMEGYLE